MFRPASSRLLHSPLALLTLFALLFMGYGQNAMGRISFEPYFSVSSTKALSSNQKKGTEEQKISQKEEKGIRAGVSFYSLFKFDLAVGQSYHVSTSKTSPIKDEYDEIDFDKEFDSSTEGQETKKKETQNRARASLSINPSFSIFIARMKLGVTATQRIVKLYANDVLISDITPKPSYKPLAGAGLGVRFNSQMYALAEYSLNFYKFPDTKYFERELALSFGFSI